LSGVALRLFRLYELYRLYFAMFDAFFMLEREPVAVFAEDRHASVLFTAEEVFFFALALAFLVIPLHEFRTVKGHAAQPFPRPFFALLAVDQRALRYALGVEVALNALTLGASVRVDLINAAIWHVSGVLETGVALHVELETSFAVDSLAARCAHALPSEARAATSGIGLSAIARRLLTKHQARVPPSSITAISSFTTASRRKSKASLALTTLLRSRPSHQLRTSSPIAGI